MTLRWLHISDLHFIDKDFESKNLRKKLLRYLSEKNISCDFVAITGDIFYKYNYSESYIKEMVEFVKKLIKTVNVKEENLFIIPGNHDIDRNDYDRKTLIKAIKNNKEQYKEMNNIPDKNILRLLNNHKYFIEFLKNINIEGYSHFNKVHYAIEREKFNILNINTCLSYTGEYQEDLLICQSRLPEEIDDWENSSKVNIAIGHHGLDMMQKTQKEKLTYAFSESGIDIYLCGHVHEPDFYKLYDQNDINVFVSGSNFTDDYSIPSFIINEVDLITYNGCAELYLWDKREDFWKIADTRKFEKGKREYTLKRLKKKGELIEKYSKDESAATFESNFNNIKNDEKVNQDITIYNDIFEAKDRKFDFEMNIGSKIFSGISWNSLDIINEEQNFIRDINNQYFLKHAALFRKAIFNKMKHNKNYGLKVDLKQILIVGNRAIISMQKILNYDINFESIIYIENLIYGSLQSKNRLDIIGKFLEFISSWIKYLHELLYSENNISSINEKAIKLSLINKNDKNDVDDKESDFKKNCFITISNINTYENSYAILEEDWINIVEKGLTTLIYSIYKNMGNIIDKTKNLIIDDIKDNDISILLKMIADEQKKYLRNFKGRDTYVNELYDQINKCSFIALHGKEHIGKSSLLSKVVEKLCLENEDKGGYGGEFVNFAPWITSVIYYSGKQSSGISEMMKSIISQANTRLIDKIKYEIINSQNYSSCKRIIQEILSKLIAECGNAIIILDNIDNIINNANELDFLPEHIPQNASVVISLRSNIDNIKWLRRNRQIKIMELSCIARDEITKFTNIDEINDLEGKKFNDNLWNTFAYKPGKIVELCNGYEFRNGNYSQIKLDTDENELFLESCEKWFENNNQEFENISLDILMLLALFNPVCALDIEVIQKYFKYKDIDYKLPFYRRLLINVRNQIEGIDSYKVKLSNRAFGEYVINFYFSRIDIEEYIDYIFSWFIKDKDISKKIICQFILYWKESKRLKKGFFSSKIDEFLTDLKDRNDSKFLFNVANVILNNGLNMEDIATKCLDFCLLLDDKDIKIKYALRLINADGLILDINKGEAILKELADSGYSEAQFIFGRRLILRKGLNSDIQEGKKYLLESAEQGFMNARVFVGGILLDGDVIGTDYVKAFEYLEYASSNGNILGKMILGDALIHGFCSTREAERGEKLLREASKLGSQKAKEILANRLLDGYGLKQNLEEGERLLRELAEDGVIYAQLNLANRLLDGRGIKQDTEEGRKLLRGICEQGDNEAKRILANRLLDGKGFDRDKAEGEIILRDLVENNDYESKLDLANRLIDGSSLNKDTLQGETLFKELVDDNYTDAKIDYSSRLLDNDGVSRNIEVGQSLLREVANLGNRKANIILARRLIRGEGFPENIDEGSELLKKLALEGFIKAQMELGILMIEGKCRELHEYEGEELLRKAALSGYNEAKFKLAMNLITGEKIKKNPSESKLILEELIEKGYMLAGIFLANQLIDGDILIRDRKYGESLLRKFANLGYVLPKYCLGQRLIDGDGISRDSKQGESFLREAIDMGYVDAKYLLGERLLDGDGVDRNKKEGIELLYESMDAGLIDAKLSVALRLLDGRGLDKNRIEGELLLKEVIDSGKDEAKIIYANRLIHGVGVTVNLYEGIKILKELIYQGNKRAKYILSILLLDGNGIPKDKDEGEQLLRASAIDGYYKSKVELANRLLKGNGLNKNINESILIFEEFIKENDKNGKYEYAKNLVNEYGEIKDFKKGVNILNELSEENHDKGKLLLAKILLEGVDDFYDEDRGARLLREVSEGGDKDSRIELGKRLIKGDRLEYDFKNGEQILRELIYEGHTKANVILGTAFLEDISDNRNIDEGLRLLNEVISKKLSDENDDRRKFDCIQAHMVLSKYFFSTSNSIFPNKGIAHLKEAVSLEYSPAIYELGIRYIEGKGIGKSINKGKKKLEKAIKLGDLTAKYEVGRRMKHGIKYKKDEKRGDKYINEVISEANADELRDIAFEYYKRDEFETATYLYNIAYEKGSVMAGNDLVYMLRRDEIKGNINVTNIEVLLKQGLKFKQHEDMINYALCYAYGFQRKKDWVKADNIISTINKVYSVVSWWHGLALEGDGEGDLVIGWLVRHKLIKDPDGFSITQRMNNAKKAGWDIPNWMYNIK